MLSCAIPSCLFAGEVLDARSMSMSHQSLTFEGVESTDQINRITTALMMLDGVDSVEVGRYGAEVEGKARREVLIKAVEQLKLKIKVS
jgi:hypothetical protein